MSAIADLILQRRSISRFKPQTPPREILLEGLELACWAPNHRLTEPWHFYLIGAETRAAIIELNCELVAAKAGPAAAEAKRRSWSAVPGWLVVTCDNSSDTLREREDYAACACGLQNLALYLWEQGIGMKWTTGDVTRDPRFYDLIWVDPGAETVVGLIWYGYPDEAPDSVRAPLASRLVELP